jgi:hypothetical protein
MAAENILLARVKLELSVCLIKRHAMKATEEVGRYRKINMGSQSVNLQGGEGVVYEYILAGVAITKTNRYHEKCLSCSELCLCITYRGPKL